MAEHDPRDDAESNDRKGFGSKLLGLFVESEAATPGEDAASEIERIARESAAPSPVATPPPLAPGPVASSPPGAPVTARPTPPGSYKIPDFQGIFRSVGMPDDERDRLAKAEELLRSLPAGTPVALQRQIVEGTLRAFGLAPEKISSAAKRAVGALDQYAKVGAEELESRQANTEKRLTELRAEQDRLVAALAERQAMQATLLHDLRTRQDELRAVITFFADGPA